MKLVDLWALVLCCSSLNQTELSMAWHPFTRDHTWQQHTYWI